MVRAKPYCRHCQAIQLRRNGRSGFWQKEVLARLGYFPWECGQCRRVYLLKLRSFGYRSDTGHKAPASLLDRLLLKDQN